MNLHFGMKKHKHIFLFLLCCVPLIATAQYTDVINSNRPGQSVSAYSIGKNVLQAEVGLFYDHQEHDLLGTKSELYGSDFALRYGLLFEQLELIYEGAFLKEAITLNGTAITQNNSNLSANRMGLKFLVYDPFKNEERNKPNLKSWRANNKFQLKNLVPAISIYAGANYTFDDNPFLPNIPTFTQRGMIATQSKLTPRSVLITNFIYDYIGSDDPMMSYIITYTRALKNPKWSIFIEHEGIQSDRYSDGLFRGGTAYLFSRDFQIDAFIGTGYKTTPTRLFGNIGVSYRLDMHQDSYKTIESDADKSIKKGAMKTKKKGFLGLFKKKKKKQKTSEIEF